jgi:hypothetical protein
MEQTFETKKGKFLIRPYGPQDEEGVLSLWSAAFEKTLPPGLWRWKYVENPYGNQILLCVSEAGEVLAMYSGIPYRANWSGVPVSITQLMDIMSHPAYRGEGLFMRTAQVFKDFFGPPGGSVCLYGFPGKYHFQLGEKFLDYKPLTGGTGFLTAPCGGGFGQGFPFRGRIEPITDVDPDFDRLAGSYLPQYPFSLVRDSAFLRWRFLAHPQKRYQIWGYRGYRGRNWKGYAVIALKDKTASVVDLLVPNSKKTVRDFLARLKAQLGGQGVETVQVWVPNVHFAGAALISAGFEAGSEPFGFIPTIRILHPDLSWNWVSENIYYTMADADLI